MTDLQDLGREIGRLRAEVDRRLSAGEERAREGATIMQGQGTILQRVDFELNAIAKAYDRLNETVETHVKDPTGKTGVIVRMRHIEEHAGPDGVLDRAVEANTTLLRDVAQTLSKLKDTVAAIEDARKTEAEARKDRRRFGVREVLVPLILGLVGGLLLLAGAKMWNLA